MEEAIARYKEIIAGGLYGRVRFLNIRGIVTDSDIRFLDPDGEIVGLINPDQDGLFGVFDDRFFDVINEAVGVIYTDPDEYFV